jgi:hypothetical protein
MAAAEVGFKSPLVPLFQRGEISKGMLTPSLEKHVLSVVEGRGRGDFWVNQAGISSELLRQDARSPFEALFAVE